MLDADRVMENSTKMYPQKDDIKRLEPLIKTGTKRLTETQSSERKNKKRHPRRISAY